MCGSATELEDVEELLVGKTIDLYLTDPPYNVDYKGSTGLTIINDSMSDDSFHQLLTDAYIQASSVMKKGAPFYIFHADSEGYNFRGALKKTDLVLKQCLIWVKNSMVLGRQDYQWQHEPILYGWKAGDSHKWYGQFNKKTVIDDGQNIANLDELDIAELARDLFNETTVIREDKPARNGDHPTMKPIKLLARLIQNSSKKGDIVFDHFMGSGSTLIACEQTGRTAYGIELDPKYCDVIRKRYWKFTHNDDEEGWQDGTS
jgi:DNA modification methylase